MTTLTQKLAAAGIAAALSLIVLFEGNRQASYLDPIGIPTVCRGHTGQEVRVGQFYTQQECDELTLQDLLKARAIVDQCVKRPLNDNQRAAFSSFVFNVGPGQVGKKDGFCILKNGQESTMLKMLNMGHHAQACDQMLRWNKANGIVLPGLVKRRLAERELCLKN